MLAFLSSVNKTITEQYYLAKISGILLLCSFFCLAIIITSQWYQHLLILIVNYVHFNCDYFKVNELLFFSYPINADSQCV